MCTVVQYTPLQFPRILHKKSIDFIMLKNVKWIIIIILNVGSSTLKKFIETAAFQFIFPVVDYVSTFTVNMYTLSTCMCECVLHDILVRVYSIKLSGEALHTKSFYHHLLGLKAINYKCK